MFFTIVFFLGVFIFHHCFSSVCFVDCIFFISPPFFTLTAFLLLFCQVLCFCIAVLRVLCISESFFCTGVFYLTLLSHICHSIASTTDSREIFLLSGVFYITLLSNIWYNRMFHQPTFKGSLGVDSFSLMF